MILRVTRSRVVPGREQQVVDVLRAMTSTMGESIEGLHSAVFGRALDGGTMSFVAITEWESIEAIKAVYGHGWSTRSILPGAEEYILETTVEHFESTLDDVSTLVEQRRQP